jgi:hypothetical protein
MNYWHYTCDSGCGGVACNALVSRIGSAGDFVMPGEAFDEGMEWPHHDEFWHGSSLDCRAMTTKFSGCLLPWQQLNTGSRVRLCYMYAGRSSASMLSTTTSVGGTRLRVTAGCNGSSIPRTPASTTRMLSPTVPSSSPQLDCAA